MDFYGMNDFFRKSFQLQQDMARKWAGVMTGMAQTQEQTTSDGERKMSEASFADAAKTYAEMCEDWRKQFADNPWMNFQPWSYNLFNSENIMTDMFLRMMNGGKTLADLGVVWQQLIGKDPFKSREEIFKFIDDNREAYMKLAEDFMLPFLPEAMRPFFFESAELLKQYEKIGKELTEPWFELGADEAFKKLTGGDGSAYADFYRAMNKAYEDSYGKIFNAAGGLTREQNEAVMNQFDSYCKMMISMTDLMALMAEVSRENMVSVVEAFQNLTRNGNQPQSLRDFYDMWIKINQDAFVKLFGTPQFSRVFCEFAKRACDFKIRFDKAMEQFLSWAPVPKNSDMASLYRTVYDLRKSDYRNTKELVAMQEELASLRASVEELTKSEKRGTRRP